MQVVLVRPARGVWMAGAQVVGAGTCVEVGVQPDKAQIMVQRMLVRPASGVWMAGAQVVGAGASSESRG